MLWLFSFVSTPEIGVGAETSEPAQKPGLVQCPRWPYVAVALYSYESSNPTELNFTSGERLLVAGIENRWWRAKNQSGDEGIAPYNFLHLQ